MSHKRPNTCNATWYRSCNNEINEVMNNIYGKIPRNDVSSVSSQSKSNLFERSESEACDSSERVVSPSTEFLEGVEGQLPKLIENQGFFPPSKTGFIAENVDNNVNDYLSDSVLTTSDSESSDSSGGSHQQVFSEIQQHVLSSESMSSVQKLKSWAVTMKISHTALKPLLEILSNSLGQHEFRFLPKDPRTFLSTPRKTNIRLVNPGSYYHFGIRDSLERLFTKFCYTPVGNIVIGINIDGLPIAKSSSSQMYPILGMICRPQTLEKTVFLIGIYHGYEKPKDFNDFLFDFVKEASSLID